LREPFHLKPWRLVRVGHIDRRFEGAFSIDMTLVASEVTPRVNQAARQEAPQPGYQFALALAVKLVECLGHLKECWLHDVRGIELATQARIKVQPGQQVRRSAGACAVSAGS
jgi:hypothetical protein